MKDLWLTIGIRRHQVEVETSLEGGHTDLSLLWHGQRLNAASNRLQGLMEKAGLVRLNARVEEEDESRHGWISDTESSGWDDIVRAV